MQDISVRSKLSKKQSKYVFFFSIALRLTQRRSVNLKRVTNGFYRQQAKAGFRRSIYIVLIQFNSCPFQSVKE